jgi:hypothetical protein
MTHVNSLQVEINEISQAIPVPFGDYLSGVYFKIF